MTRYEFFLASSLEKVFPSVCPQALPEAAKLSVLQGELPAVQLVYTKTTDTPARFARQPFTLTVEGAPVPPRLRSVELMPSDFPSYETADEHYITRQPGLFPDLLRPLAEQMVIPLNGQYRAIWVDFPGLEAAAPGCYTITITAAAQRVIEIPNGTVIEEPEADKLVFASSFSLEVLNAALPPQTLLHTEWFHGDGLAHQYNLPVFAPAYWDVVENYIAFAGEEMGINMMLTPIFTPPLDTAVGGERLTVQLVDVEVVGEGYRFGFDKLERWCGICAAHGITHLEMAHFFTQWGAKATPKIMAMEHGEEKQIFGWDVPATSPRYRAFLEALIPALQSALAGFGYDNAHVVYHVSDEPSEAHLESYKAAKAQVADLLQGCTIMDALSEYEYYAEGLVENPVPANDAIQPFIDNHVPNLWVYYCCAQCQDVPNRFYAMPSARNRIMGVLMYLYDIKGFLHWGYNFYNTQFSVSPLNPYENTHAGYAFPSGDPYLVYPGADGKPLASIRGQVQRNGLDDLRALQLLETLSNRAFVEALIYEGVEGVMTFTQYPRTADYLLNLHEKVNAEIAKRV